ncbi:MAG: amidase [Ilumatobacteraceae bacterium]|nr:amidase [Ilumatobacteraceae bacterium]
MTAAHAFTDELSRLDAVATAELVRTRQITPAEVVAAAIERVKAVNPELNAVAAEDYDRALDLAPLVNAKGPLAGVPTFIKDGTDVAGLPTRNGTDALAEVGPAKHTAPIAQQLFDMGTIGLGKSRLPEFGFIPSTEFADGTATHNPWNLDHTPGGSSGGAAALVAAGVVPIAHAQDGGGSTRIPAACNGLVGLKPTRGRLLPDPHARLLPVKIVFDGVVTRTVRDTAAYYQAADVRYRSPKLEPLGSTRHPIDRPLRVGTFTATPTGAVLDAATRRVFDETIDLLEGLGHRVEPVQLPIDEQFVVDFIRYWSMLVYAVDHAGGLLYDRAFDATKLTPVTHGLAAEFASDWKGIVGTIRRLRASTATFEAAMGSLDVILTPTVAQLPPVLGHLSSALPYEVVFPRVIDWIGFPPLANANGAPSISLPMGHDAETNLPVGMMFSGHWGDDGLLLRLALQLEAARPFPSLDPTRV